MVGLGFVVAMFNRGITERMEAAARERAAEHDATVIETIHVPGAYDAPLAADRLARRDDIAAVAVIGAIISGDTDHEYVIAEAAAEGLTDVSLNRDTPVTLGIAGPGMDADAAHDRTDYGADAVESAIELAGAL